ncbi:septation ring formation regulator EzrA [Longimonas halophila]|uniref:Septation ring formation regulator EzrA n=1 Tax=Longimonas halophila TaxID=1469170 RepID=A0A2H3NT30_9BACT|nr:septum formation initiator family protein [Longimonas halophila]PEN06987.1 septation ring formation regulator EzrA [Longimonas halophila]
MSISSVSRGRLIRWGLVLVVVVGSIWVLFLDTHSVMHRIELHREHEALRAENERLQTNIDALREQLADSLSDAEIERIAREEYGMQYPNETVHPIE